MSNGHGGARPGSGRKPNEIQLERGKKIADALPDAEYALQLFIDTMRDKGLPWKLRLIAAKEVKDTVWGKPAQRAIISNEQGEKFELSIHHSAPELVGDED